MPTLLDLAFLLGRPPLVRALGVPGCIEARATAKAALPGLVALLPPFPNRPGARTFLEATCALVAFHRALPGRTAAENAALLQASLRHAAGWIPRPLRRLYRWMFFQPWYHRRLFAAVVGDPLSEEPGDFAGVFVPDERGFGVDYSGCAIQTFLQRIGASELGPEVCGLDELESEVFGLGLERSGTLGRGAPRCDFRWRR